MIEVKGDLLNSNCHHIVHGCNAQGVMGSGVAKAIKDKWPEAYYLYRSAHEKGLLRLGEVISVVISPKLTVHNAITQIGYGTDRRHVNYAAIATAFLTIRSHVKPGETVGIPMIGAGLGGGDWNIIKAIIEDAMGEIPVILYRI